MSQQRITKEFSDLRLNHHLINVHLDDEFNLFKWTAQIKGPKDSPYEEGIFLLSIEIPNHYPFKPPKISFKTKIFHPNVNSDGTLCLTKDILKDFWVPACTIEKVLLFIISLLADPHSDEPLVPEIAEIFLNDRMMFNKIARDWTARFSFI